MSGASITAQGGFNTGRLYSANGQRIYWWQSSEGFVAFKDCDRMIEGHFDWSRSSSPTPAEVMRAYDGHRYTMANIREPMPEGFDFGPGLRL